MWQFELVCVIQSYLFSSQSIITLTEQLKKRLNRRLTKIAKWVDCSSEDRQIEFRNLRSAPQPTAVVNSTFAFRPSAAPPQTSMVGRFATQQPQYTASVSGSQQPQRVASSYIPVSSSTTVAFANQSSSITQTAFNAQQSQQSIHSINQSGNRGVEESKMSENTTGAGALSDAVANNIDVTVMVTNEPSLTDSFSTHASIATATAPLME
jgi:hypothetical protein